MTGGRRSLRLAHRGDWRRAPENSIPALVAALSVPACDGVEFDVRIAADGVPVLNHDETLERVHGRPDRVDALAAADLARIGVPSLTDALAALPAPALLDVELKGPGHGDATVDALEAARGRGLERAVISSFDPGTLAAIRRLRPEWPRWLNALDLSPATIHRAVRLGCRAVAAEWRSIGPRSIQGARSAGLDVAAWTVRRRPTYGRLAGLGVVAICVEASALDGGGKGSG